MSKQECTCYLTDEKYWTTHYGAVEPGSMWEPNPDCLVHFPKRLREQKLTAKPRITIIDGSSTRHAGLAYKVEAAPLLPDERPFMKTCSTFHEAWVRAELRAQLARIIGAAA